MRLATLLWLVTCIGDVKSWMLPPAIAASSLPMAPELVSNWIAANPHQSSALVSTARGIIGDSVAQRMENTKTYDARRTATYVSWCNLVAEFYTHPWNVIMVERWLPAFIGETLCTRNLLAALAIDNFVLSPFVYYPLFYLFKDLAAGCFNLRQTLEQYRREFWPQMRLMVSIWLPANLLSFTVVPPHLRVAYTSLVGTAWVLVLSLKTKLLATMGEACECAADDAECALGDAATESTLMGMVAKNWVFVLSFYALQKATGAMPAVGLVWLGLLLWAGLAESDPSEPTGDAAA